MQYSTLLREHYFATHHRANPMSHAASSSYNATSNHILFLAKTKTQLCLHNSNKCMSCCHSCIETQHRTETCLAQIETRHPCVAAWRAVIQRANEFVSCLFCDVALNKTVFAYCCATVRKKNDANISIKHIENIVKKIKNFHMLLIKMVPKCNQNL